MNSKELISILIVIAFFLSSSANAREWYIQPTVNLRAVADDNLRLRTRETEDVAGFRASFFAKYGTRTETSNIDLTTLLDVVRYWGQENLDREDLDLKVGSNFKITERNQVGLDALYVRDTSITSEQDLTGLTQVQVDREKFNISPHWTYSLSEIQTIQTRYTHEEVTYEKSSASFLSSYKTDSINLNYIHQWQDDLQVFVSFTALQYSLTDLDIETDDYSINTGIDYNYSETLSFNAMVGTRYSVNRTGSRVIVSRIGNLLIPNTIPGTENSSLGSLFSLGVKKQFESGRFDISYSRSVSPSGSGEFLQADRFKSSGSYSITEHLSFGISGVISRTTSTDNTRDTGRTYFSVEPKLNWRLNRQTRLSGGYRYRMQEFDNRNENAVSNSIFMTIDFQWDKLSTNRF
ncbi:MAG: hypothetical protein L3J59_16070 [Methylococcaceae bacterium]|nr:hypothetical protein [Methylococcaceae bacterium]